MLGLTNTVWRVRYVDAKNEDCLYGSGVDVRFRGVHSGARMCDGFGEKELGPLFTLFRGSR